MKSWIVASPRDVDALVVAYNSLFVLSCIDYMEVIWSKYCDPVGWAELKSQRHTPTVELKYE